MTRRLSNQPGDVLKCRIVVDWMVTSYISVNRCVWTQPGRASTACVLCAVGRGVITSRNLHAHDDEAAAITNPKPNPERLKQPVQGVQSACEGRQCPDNRTKTLR